jgi:hypothetical protein
MVRVLWDRQNSRDLNVFSQRCLHSIHLGHRGQIACKLLPSPRALQHPERPT